MVVVPDPTFPEKDIDIREILSDISKEWKLMVVVFAIFVAGSLGFALTRTPVFTCDSKFITKTGGAGKAEGFSGLAALTGLNLGGGNAQDPFDHLEEVIQNAEFMDRILDRSWALKGDSVRLGDIWNLKIDSTLPDWKYRLHRKRLDKLRSQVVKLGEQGGLKVLTVSESDPGLAYQINRYVLELLNDYILRDTKSQAKESRIFIEKRINEADSDLRASEEDLTHFLARNLELTAPPIAAQYRRLQRKVTINEEIFLQLKKQYELIRIEEKKDQPLVIVVKNPELPISKSKPKRTMLVMVGAVFGAFFGCLAGFFRAVSRKK